jgi:hypothetical protein
MMTIMTTTKNARRASGPIDVSFDAALQRSQAPGGWTYVVWPGAAEYFGTRGLVRVAGEIDSAPFEGALMALGDGTHKLAVTAAVRRIIGKESGDSVRVHLTARR